MHPPLGILSGCVEDSPVRVEPACCSDPTTNPRPRGFCKAWQHRKLMLQGAQLRRIGRQAVSLPGTCRNPASGRQVQTPGRSVDQVISRPIFARTFIINNRPPTWLPEWPPSTSLFMSTVVRISRLHVKAGTRASLHGISGGRGRVTGRHDTGHEAGPRRDPVPERAPARKVDDDMTDAESARKVEGKSSADVDSLQASGGGQVSKRFLTHLHRGPRSQHLSRCS
jgi:hypothetical protein